MQPRRNNQNRNRNNRNNRNRGPQQRGGDRGGPRGRINVKQCIDKRDSFLNKARDAQMGGDRVEAEYFLQHAEHFQRLINEYNEEQGNRSASEFTEGAESEENAADGMDRGAAPDADAESSAPPKSRHRRPAYAKTDSADDKMTDETLPSGLPPAIVVDRGKPAKDAGAEG